MADFCKECSTAMFGKDYGDFEGLTKPEDQANDMYAAVLCEGCGPIQVDVEGACVTPSCGGDHRKQRITPLLVDEV